MNIKQAEQATGVSSQNIRFYEKQGLITPARNRINAYREYDETALRTLKMIRALRMLDMPLDEVKQVLDGTLPLPRAAAEQQRRLEERTIHLQAAIRFCADLQRYPKPADALDVDACLAQMENAETMQKGSFFAQWLTDYREIARAQHEERFTFAPDGAVTNPHQFTSELFIYAAAHGLDLVITKESMYPEFTIDGVPYTADRSYTPIGGGGPCAPLAIIRCARVLTEAEQAENRTPRKRFLRVLRYTWPDFAGAVLMTVCWLQSYPITSWVFWMMMVCFWGIAAFDAFANYNFYFNMDGKDNTRHRSRKGP